MAGRRPRTRRAARNELVALLRRHAPEKLPNVGRLLSKWAGREEDLIANVRRKYAPSSEPRPRSAPMAAAAARKAAAEKAAEKAAAQKASPQKAAAVKAQNLALRKKHQKAAEKAAPKAAQKATAEELQCEAGLCPPSCPRRHHGKWHAGYGGYDRSHWTCCNRGDRSSTHCQRPDRGKTVKTTYLTPYFT